MMMVLAPVENEVTTPKRRSMELAAEEEKHRCMELPPVMGAHALLGLDDEDLLPALPHIDPIVSRPPRRRRRTRVVPEHQRW